MDEKLSIVVHHLDVNPTVGLIVQSFAVILTYVMIKKPKILLFRYANLIALSIFVSNKFFSFNICL